MVVGAGNVAIDVARMLALAPAELAVTDTADHAIDVLSTSGIEEITILARRGPLQAAFTNPELLEMGVLDRADVEVVGAELDELSAVALQEADKTRTRNVEILQEYAARVRRPACRSPSASASCPRRWSCSATTTGTSARVRIEHNEVVARDDGSLAARGTGTFEDLPAQLVFRSIGYTGRPVAGISFDERRGLIRNEGGRVTDADGAHHRGEYVAGLDQARAVGRDRDEQEGRPGHRRTGSSRTPPRAGSTSPSRTTSTRRSPSTARRSSPGTAGRRSTRSRPPPAWRRTRAGRGSS